MIKKRLMFRRFLLTFLILVLIVPNVLAAKQVSATGPGNLPLINPKKGVGISVNNSKTGLCNWFNKVKTLHLSWYYHYGYTFPADLPDSVQWVPMIPMYHGDTTSLKVEVDYIDSLARLGRAHYILGFNEPEGHMTVQQALQAWPYIMKAGLPLVSPAPSHAGDQWIVDFMHGVDSLHYRVDYVAFHWYGKADSSGFINLLKKTYTLFHRPLWITEFAVADNQAKTIQGNVYSPARVLTFMEQILPVLDTLNFVDKYAWHSSPNYTPKHWSARLFDNSTCSITQLGRFYSQYQYGKPIPSKPILVSPGRSATGVTRSTFFKWRIAIAATRYHLQVATASALDSTGAFEPQSVVFDTTFFDSSLTDTTVQLPLKLDADKNYYWHVCASDTFGTSGYSSVYSFKTGSGILGISQPHGLPEKLSLAQNYPSPFNPSTVIKYTLPHSGFVTLRVFNVLSQKVATLVDSRQCAGYHEVAFHAHNFASGVYFCVLRNGQARLTRKMLLLK